LVMITNGRERREPHSESRSRKVEGFNGRLEILGQVG